MPRPRERVVPKIGEIVTAVVGDLSLEQASIRINYAVGKEGIRTLRKGKVGWEVTLRSFAEGYSSRICELFGPEVIEQFGECNAQTVSDWMAGLAGYEPKYRPQELTYEPELEDTLLAGFEGAEDLSEPDRRVLEVIVRAYIAEKRGRSAE